MTALILQDIPVACENNYMENNRTTQGEEDIIASKHFCIWTWNWKLRSQCKWIRERTGDGNKSKGSKRKMWLSHQIKRQKKVEFGMVSEYQEK